MLAVLWWLLAALGGVLVLAVVVLALPVKLDLALRTAPRWRLTVGVRLLGGLTPALPVHDSARKRRRGAGRPAPERPRARRRRRSARAVRALSGAPRLLMGLLRPIRLERLAGAARRFARRAPRLHRCARRRPGRCAAELRSPGVRAAGRPLRLARSSGAMMAARLDRVVRVGGVAVAALAEGAVRAGPYGVTASGSKAPVAVLVREGATTTAFDVAGERIPLERALFEREAAGEAPPAR